MIQVPCQQRLWVPLSDGGSCRPPSNSASQEVSLLEPTEDRLQLVEGWAAKLFLAPTRSHGAPAARLGTILHYKG